MDRPVPRVGLIRDVDTIETAPELREAVDGAAELLAGRGIDVVEVDPTPFAEAQRLWGMLLLDDMRAMRRRMQSLDDPEARAAMDGMLHAVESTWGLADDRAGLVEAWTRRNELLTEVLEQLESTPTLIMPPSARPPLLQGADVADQSTISETMRAQWPATSLPVLGLPGLAMPFGRADGPTPGIQLVGGRFTEQMLLQVGGLIEEHTGSAPPVTPVTTETTTDRIEGHETTPASSAAPDRPGTVYSYPPC